MADARKYPLTPSMPNRRIRTQIAAKSGTDERTVYRYLAGDLKRRNDDRAARIAQAVQELGLEVQTVAADVETTETPTA